VDAFNAVIAVTYLLFGNEACWILLKFYEIIKYETSQHLIVKPKFLPCTTIYSNGDKKNRICRENFRL